MGILPASRGSQLSSHRAGKPRRRGALTVMSALMLVLMLVLAAFAVDVGMLCLAKAELQRSADASALAGAEELLNQRKLRSGRSIAGLGEDELSRLMKAERTAV